ncbi:MAG: sulfatase-like hydrolase/transferase [Planctomycetes bacterium]|nr:sulfatase-like hydrolase/transferase [Planctomycetota bacterium]
MRRRAFLEGLAGTGILGAGIRAASEEGSEGSPARPNILLIISDQFRHDALGCVRSWVETPCLDRLAKQGVRFARAYTPQALCSPARGSIFTGLYPHAHRLEGNVYDLPDATKDPRWNLGGIFPKALRAAGYVTGYVGKWHLGEEKPDGFDLWQGFNSLLPHWLGKKDESPYRSDVETDAGIAFLEANRARPFFLCQSYYPPHTPYTAPKRFRDLYRDVREVGEDPPEYYAAASAVDWNAGRLVERLDALGLGDRTLVIFAADHGEVFGRRPGANNKNVCFDGSARIPFIVRFPPAFAGGAVRRELVGLTDIAPTILDAARLRAPSVLHGRSLLDLARGSGPGWRESIVLQNHPIAREKGERITSRAIVAGDRKLILRDRLPARGETLHDFYDLARDPQEHANLFGRDHGREIEDLLGRLESWARDTRDATAVDLAAACRKALAG